MTKPTNLQHFHKFWSVVWRKVGKLEAERKFIQALKREPAEFIIAAAEAYTKKVKGSNPQFLPHPATWLHAGRYYDEEEETSTVSDYFDRLENEDTRIC